MLSAELNLRHLNAFVKTCELGTLLAAAEAVHLSQPALTQGLQRLEDQLNVSLFQRERDGMRPTPTALRLLPRVKAALKYIGSTRVTNTQIGAFAALATQGSYARASVSTAKAPASVHRAVKDLEAVLERPLLQRSGRTVRLTASGRTYARRYRLAYAELDAALDEIVQTQSDGGGQLSIGAMPLCRARVLPDAIISFRRSHPRCQIRVAEGSFAELVEPLRDGVLDVLVGALRDPAIDPDLAQTPLFVDEPVVVGRPEHPLANRKRVTLKDLARFEWCLPPSGVPLRDRWQSMFGAAGIPPPEVRVECGSALMTRQLLRAADYLTILSPDQVDVELKAGWLAQIAPTDPELARNIGAIWRRDWRPTPVQTAFLRTLGVADYSQ